MTERSVDISPLLDELAEYRAEIQRLKSLTRNQSLEIARLRGLTPLGHYAAEWLRASWRLKEARAPWSDMKARLFRAIKGEFGVTEESLERFRQQRDAAPETRAFRELLGEQSAAMNAMRAAARELKILPPYRYRGQFSDWEKANETR